MSSSVTSFLFLLFRNLKEMLSNWVQAQAFEVEITTVLIVILWCCLFRAVVKQDGSAEAEWYSSGACMRGRQLICS